MGLLNIFKSSKTVLVVDGIAMGESFGMKGRVPPRQQMMLLRRLSRFARREKLEMIVVLVGEPLNKAPAGKRFEDGVLVLYSPSFEAHPKNLLKVLRSKGRGATLIAGRNVIRPGIPSVYVSTFRKAFDSLGLEGESERTERGGGRGRSRRRNGGGKSTGGNGGGKATGGNGGGKPAGGKREKPLEKPESPNRRGGAESDAISELIDLVD